MEVDPNQRARAVKRLRDLGGLSEAAAIELVDAALAGALEHAFELINGSGPVPTTVTTLKADQLRYVCQQAGRMVSQREVEILFRVKSSVARQILATMVATYEEGLRDHFVAHMREDATVIASGSKESGLTWTLRFTESSTFETARGELLRLDYIREAEVNPTRRSITIPQTISKGSKKVDVLSALGLQAPAT